MATVVDVAVSSKRNPNACEDWRTPAAILDPINRHFGRIAFDPATTRDNLTNAEYIRTEDCDPDGLATEWHTFGGLTFVNPPYRKAWYDKIGRELSKRSTDSELIALLPAKPGTAYFQNLVELCDATCFVRGRLTFDGAPTSAPFESALLYAGDRRARFVRAFRRVGWIV